VSITVLNADALEGEATGATVRIGSESGPAKRRSELRGPQKPSKLCFDVPRVQRAPIPDAALGSEASESKFVPKLELGNEGTQ
jgi:hypothetical protein